MNEIFFLLSVLTFLFGMGYVVWKSFKNSDKNPPLDTR